MKTHPAPYSEELIPHLIDACRGFEGGLMLDPFAGIGRGKRIADALGMRFVGIEIEPEWAIQGQGVLLGDSSQFFRYIHSNRIDVICTSPAYGNRLADSYAGSPKDREDLEATGKIRRRTYRIFLGRELHANNGGRYQWGKTYKTIHAQVWEQCFRVLKPGGLLVLNVSDHYRKHRLVEVTAWHEQTVREIGFEIEDKIPVETRRFREGRNAEMRTDNEWIIKCRKPS